MLLLTGASGLLGEAVLRRLIARGIPVRCLVRDPRRLGAQRVRVQLAIGDLADPSTWRNALRGVDAVVHLAGGARDQPRASVEELNGLAAWRLLRAAERVGARHFVWLEPLGATPHHPMRMHRAKALAAAAVRAAPLPTTTLAHSLIYAPGDRHLRWLERLGLLPAVPLVGRGAARTQPLWAEDAADCVLALLAAPPDGHARVELAGPEILTQREVVKLALRAAGHRRRTVPCPACHAARRPARRGGAGRARRAGDLGRGPAAVGRHADRARLGGRRGAGHTAAAAWARCSASGRNFRRGCVAGARRRAGADRGAAGRALVDGPLDGAARLAAPALGLGGEQAAERYAVIHGLYWLTANLAAERPLLLLVDDLQWADPPSQSFLASLACRLDGVAAGPVAALRPPVPGEDRALVDALPGEPLRPAPLTLTAVSALAEAKHGSSGRASECHAATGGNPLWVHAVLDHGRLEQVARGRAALARGDPAADARLVRARARLAGGRRGRLRAFAGAGDRARVPDRADRLDARAHRRRARALGRGGRAAARPRPGGRAVREPSCDLRAARVPRPGAGRRLRDRAVAALRVRRPALGVPRAGARGRPRRRPLHDVGRRVGDFVEYGPDGRPQRVFPPTGREVASTQMHWFGLADGEVVEHWANKD